jgi:carnitine 3-dehydrogenase
MGTFLTYRLGGGELGMRHFLAQFGPALKLPWTHLTEVPELDDELLDRLVAQSEAQAKGRSIEELTNIRDDCLVAVLRALREQGFGAGELLAHNEQVLLARAAADGRPDQLPDGRLVLHEVVVVPEWIDYNGHLTESRYLEILADATDALLRRIGIDEDSVAAGGSSYFTVETHIRHLGEGHRGQRLYVATRLVSHDVKRLHLFHELHRREDDVLLATGEHMLLHVSRQTGRTAPAPAAVLDALASVAASQRGLAMPEGAGSRIGHAGRPEG